ncbi:MAG: hypothetical protein WC785_08325 [Tatlockia sp.]|jgi:hypothetical protein
MLKKLINRTLKPFLVLAGLATLSVGLLLVNPSTMFHALFQYAYSPDYAIIILHWSFMITLVGLAMIYSAFVERGRVPILLFALMEKVGFVALIGIYWHAETTRGYFPALIMDSFISLYLFLYFVSFVWRRRKV